MIRLALLFSFMFTLSSHGFEWPVVAANVPALLVAYQKSTPTATATATNTPTPTATATVSGPILVQQKTSTTTGRSDVTVTFDSPIATGSLIVVTITYIPTANTIVNVTNTNLDSFTQQVSSVGTGIAAETWTGTNSSGGDTDIIISQDSGSLRVTANISEWSGLSNSSAEAIQSGTGLAGTSVSTGSVIPSSAHNLLIAVGGWTADQYSSGPTNSFVRLTPEGGGAVYQEAAYLYQTSATTKSTGWTLSAPGLNWAAAIIALPAP